MKAIFKNITVLAASLSLILVATSAVMAGDLGHCGFGYKGYGYKGFEYKEGQFFNRLTGQMELIKGFPVGTEVLIPGQFGATAGSAYLYCEGQRFDCKVVNWTPAGVTVLLPVTTISGPVYGMLICHNAGFNFGGPINSLPIQLLPPPVAPAAAAPAGGVVAPIDGVVAPVDGAAPVGAGAAGAVAPAVDAGAAPVDGAAAGANVAPADAAAINPAAAANPAADATPAGE